LDNIQVTRSENVAGSGTDINGVISIIHSEGKFSYWTYLCSASPQFEARKMQFHRLLSAFALFAISQSSPIVEIHQRVPDALPPAPTPACPDYCAGTAFNASLTHQYICGDFRLGPVKLPTRFSLSGLFSTYDRFGGLCPGAFLAKWTSPSTGLYVYPPDNGFQLDTAGQPIMGTVTLPVGLLIDRFGSENGTFVSPEGAPYMQRALPPVNLDTAVNGPRYVSTLIEVRQSFE
jgi:hypothetical protein